MTDKKRKPGRPKGYSPGQTRTITHQIDDYAWDSAKVEEKIKTTHNGCWTWLGTQNKFGNLMGIYKYNRPRMIQANRVIYMQETGQNVDDVAIHMSCGNKYCCNPDHFEVRENKRRTGKAGR